jgi:hypothetical protein
VSGPQGFTQPIYSRSPILDGVELTALFGSWEKSPLAASVFPIQMGDGRAIVQRVARTTNDSEAPVGTTRPGDDVALTAGPPGSCVTSLNSGRPVC